jgi:hypothetical protein
LERVKGVGYGGHASGGTTSLVTFSAGVYAEMHVKCE